MTLVRTPLEVADDIRVMIIVSGLSASDAFAFFGTWAMVPVSVRRCGARGNVGMAEN